MTICVVSQVRGDCQVRIVVTRIVVRIVVENCGIVVTGIVVTGPFLPDVFT